jgi:hypothetical protein
MIKFIPKFESKYIDIFEERKDLKKYHNKKYLNETLPKYTLGIYTKIKDPEIQLFFEEEL